MEKSNHQENYEKFMEQYQDYYVDYMNKNEVFDSFYAYGPLSEKYWTFKHRILVCNLEPYDEREGVIKVDIDLYKEWIKAPTGIYTAKFITGLIKALNQENRDESISLNNVCNEELLSYMENIAYMNFRISSGKNRTADKIGILKDVRTHPDYLIAQINSLYPDMLIIGGEVGLKAYNELFNTNLKFDTTVILKGKVICSIQHPSKPRPEKYEYYNEKVIEILNCLEVIQKTQEN